MWINDTTEKVYRLHSEVRADFKRVSFPRKLTGEVLARFNVCPVKPTDPPVVGHTQNVNEAPPRKINGDWEQVWVVTDASAEEVARRVEGMEKSVRQHRDDLLAETDWMALSDTPQMSEAWASYRQALRDITDQAGFPYDVTWPEKPSS